MAAMVGSRRVDGPQERRRVAGLAAGRALGAGDLRRGAVRALAPGTGERASRAADLRLPDAGGYFPRALRHSGYVLPVGEIAELESGMLSEEELPANEVESAVAGRLITAVGEGQVLGLLVLAFLALVVIDRRYGDGG